MSTFNPTTSTKLAKTLSSLHVPGSPVLFTNIWDPPSANTALSFPSTKALATASFAIAHSLGIEDDDLTLSDNLSRISLIRSTLIKSGKADSIPFSADLQDGYGDQLVEAIEKAVELGVVGCNLEDTLRSPIGTPGKLIPAEEQGERIKLAIKTAKDKGVEGFVVNARTDVVKLGGSVEEAIERGKIYLEAGATTVFVWGYVRGLRDAEVKQLVEALGGKVSVIHMNLDGFLSVKEIGELGVARISMGPLIWKKGVAAVKEAMRKAIEGV